MEETRQDDLLDDLVYSVKLSDKDAVHLRRDIKEKLDEDASEAINYTERIRNFTGVIKSKGVAPSYLPIRAFLEYHDNIVKLNPGKPNLPLCYMNVFMDMLGRNNTMASAVRYANEAFSKIVKNPDLISGGKVPTTDELFPQKKK